MKANQKFLRNDEDAVSPVIAVILMVAITVVLAATVYVWVSGFSGSGGEPAKTIALSSSGAIKGDCSGTDDCKTYTVASASPGLKYEGISFVLDGVTLTVAGTCGSTPLPTATTNYVACAGATTRAATDVITGGDKITFRATDGGLSGKSLQVLDPGSNSVILTLTVS